MGSMKNKQSKPKYRTIVKLGESYYANIPKAVVKELRVDDFTGIKVFAFEADRDPRSLTQGTDIIVRLVK